MTPLVTHFHKNLDCPNIFGRFFQNLFQNVHSFFRGQYSFGQCSQKSKNKISLMTFLQIRPVFHVLFWLLPPMMIFLFCLWLASFYVHIKFLFLLGRVKKKREYGLWPNPADGGGDDTVVTMLWGWCCGRGDVGWWKKYLENIFPEKKSRNLLLCIPLEARRAEALPR